MASFNRRVNLVCGLRKGFVENKALELKYHEKKKKSNKDEKEDHLMWKKLELFEGKVCVSYIFISYNTMYMVNACGENGTCVHC